MVSDQPTPRAAGTVISLHHPLRFARVQVHGDSFDRVAGYVTRSAINNAMFADQIGQPIADLAAPISALPQAGTVSDALEEMIGKQQHIALIVDEYGGTAGVVTL